MVDKECIICCNEFSRDYRIPRVLHCHHTFCAPCLQKLSKWKGVICTISCPLCRWISCTLTNQVLYVNSRIWDQIEETHPGKEARKPVEDFRVTKSKPDTNRLNKLIKKAGSVIGCKQETFEVVVERRTLNKL